jgi:hypothetical protein
MYSADAHTVDDDPGWSDALPEAWQMSCGLALRSALLLSQLILLLLLLLPVLLLVLGARFANGRELCHAFGCRASTLRCLY